MKTESSNTIVGVDVGGTTIKAGIVSPDGSVLYQNKFPTLADRGPAIVVRQINEAVLDAITQSGHGAVGAIGVGCPGVVDDEGVVKAPPNFIDWDEVPLRRELGVLFPGIPIAVENDANAAAIAESKFGAGVEYPNF